MGLQNLIEKNKSNNMDRGSLTLEKLDDLIEASNVCQESFILLGQIAGSTAEEITRSLIAAARKFGSRGFKKHIRRRKSLARNGDELSVDWLNSGNIKWIK